MKRLVLASTSPYRRELMDQLGISYVAAAPTVAEDHALDLPTDELVQELARRKAESLAQHYPDALIVGADQVAEIDGERLFKPMTAARARAQLRRLAGRTHRLVTGLVLHEPESGRTEATLDVQQMTLRALSDEAIAAYVEREQPLDCAGAYKVEGAGIALFAEMRGTDYTGIIGLPLTRLVALLERFGFEVLTA